MANWCEAGQIYWHKRVSCLRGAQKYFGKQTKLPVTAPKVYWALGGCFCLYCVCVGDGRGPEGYNEDYTDSVIAGWPIVPRLQSVPRISGFLGIRRSDFPEGGSRIKIWKKGSVSTFDDMQRF